ncbi:polyamine ABC transporter ATP-binding protein [Clostridium sediminicola]|uniref:ABC transporter ATP-binding protein n=1 Tax=Clostridium sediminicola TaxID=3114879 RepID=UPI0031F252DD
MQSPVVDIRNISKVFGENIVVDRVSLQIPKESFTTFLGPSGCGKTTTLRMIAGFYEPDGGEIHINGRRVDQLPPYKRSTAMVFQEYALFPHMTVFDNISYGLKLKKTSSDEIQRKVNQAAGLLQLEGLEKRFPNQLSGGQQQRVAIARALVMNPEALLLDEPLSNLDAKLRESVRAELRMIQKSLGLTSIYVTHDQQEALAMSDQIVVMKSGTIQQVGTAQEIYFKPRTKFVADFIGATNFVQGKVTKKVGASIVVNANGKELKVETETDVNLNDDVYLSIRPESIQIMKQEREPAESDCNKIYGVVKQAMFIGEKVRYYIEEKSLKGQAVTGIKEWIIDSFDSGDCILQGNVMFIIQPNKSHVIKKED